MKTIDNIADAVAALEDLTSQIDEVRSLDFPKASADELRALQRLYVLLVRDASDTAARLFTAIKSAEMSARLGK